MQFSIMAPYLQLWKSVVLIFGVQNYVLMGTNWTDKDARPASVKVKCIASTIVQTRIIYIVFVYRSMNKAILGGRGDVIKVHYISRITL